MVLVRFVRHGRAAGGWDDDVDPDLDDLGVRLVEASHEADTLIR